MIRQRLSSILTSVAVASFLAQGAHAFTGPATPPPTSNGLDQSSIAYVHSGKLISAVTFSMATGGKQVQVRVSLKDGWHPCTATGSSVRCSIPARPVTGVNRLEIQTV
jgi:hypothetical protein